MTNLPNSRRIQRTNRFGRDIRKLSEEVQVEAFRIAKRLSADIFDPSLNVKPLTGFRGLYRVVVIRDYRMIFSYDRENIFLLRIADRKEIYRKLEL